MLLIWSLEVGINIIVAYFLCIYNVLSIYLSISNLGFNGICVCVCVCVCVFNKKKLNLYGTNFLGYLLQVGYLISPYIVCTEIIGGLKR